MDRQRDRVSDSEKGRKRERRVREDLTAAFGWYPQSPMTSACKTNKQKKLSHTMSLVKYKRLMEGEKGKHKYEGRERGQSNKLCSRERQKMVTNRTKSTKKQNDTQNRACSKQESNCVELQCHQ